MLLLGTRCLRHLHRYINIPQKMTTRSNVFLNLGFMKDKLNLDRKHPVTVASHKPVLEK